MFIYFERERDREQVCEWGGAEWEEERESQNPKQALHHQLDVGLHHMNCDIMTWEKSKSRVGRLTDWATQEPEETYFNKRKHQLITSSSSPTNRDLPHLPLFHLSIFLFSQWKIWVPNIHYFHSWFSNQNIASILFSKRPWCFIWAGLGINPIGVLSCLEKISTHTNTSSSEYIFKCSQSL